MGAIFRLFSLFLCSATLSLSADDQLFSASQRIGDSILQQFDPARHHFIGIGGSPASVMAYIEAMKKRQPGISVAHLPFSNSDDMRFLSSFRKGQGFENTVAHLESFYKNNPVPAGKEVVFIEFTDTGSGVLSFKLAHDEYVRRNLGHNAPAEKFGSYVLLGRGESEWGPQGELAIYYANRNVPFSLENPQFPREMISYWGQGADKERAVSLIDSQASRWQELASEDRVFLEQQLEKALLNFASARMQGVSSSGIYGGLRSGKIKDQYRAVGKWAPILSEGRYENAPETFCGRLLRLVTFRERPIVMRSKASANSPYDFSAPISSRYQRLVREFSARIQ
jgi:hypothetical protein